LNFLAQQTRAAGGGPVGYTALNALRLEQAIPWFGYDFGDKANSSRSRFARLPHQLHKGCYTGQEIVERVRSRGQVNAAASRSASQ